MGWKSDFFSEFCIPSDSAFDGWFSYWVIFLFFQLARRPWHRLDGDCAMSAGGETVPKHTRTKLAETADYSPKNILITGGAGFIASHIATRLIENYPQYKASGAAQAPAGSLCSAGSAGTRVASAPARSERPLDRVATFVAATATDTA